MTISLDAKVSALNEFMAKFGARIASFLKLPVEDLNIQETDIVMGVAFNTKQNVYEFKMIGDSQLLPFEQRMSDKDVFLTTDLVAYIMKANKTVGDFANIMFPYIDTTEFDGADGTATEGKALESFWNGSLKIERNSSTILDNFRVRNLMYVPDKQLADNRYPTVGGEGFKLTRKPIFGGKDKIKISVSLAELSAQSRALIVGNIDDKGDPRDDMQNYGIIVLRGFLISDAAEAYSKF